MEGDYDYLDSNEEELKGNELEKTHVKFEPLTHKSGTEADFDEEEIDQEVDQLSESYGWSFIY